jgi:hypothetical protein
MGSRNIGAFAFRDVDRLALAPGPGLNSRAFESRLKEDLLPHLGIHVDRLAEGRTVDCEPQPRGLDR